MSRRIPLPVLAIALLLGGCPGDAEIGPWTFVPATEDGSVLLQPVGRPDGSVPIPVPQGCEAECVGQAAYLCVTQPSSGECVACVSDNECRANPRAFGPTCDTTTNKCTCGSDAECADNDNGHRCKTSLSRCYCDSDADCAAPLRCVGKYLSTKICAQPCASDTDCRDPSKSACDVATGECIECTGDGHCAGNPDGPVCVDGSCTCQADGDCRGGYAWGDRCRASSKRCSCQADVDCGNNPHGPTCYTSYGMCSCSSDSECKPPYSKCAAYSAYGSFKHCQRPCTADADCTGTSSLKICDVAAGVCVACLQDADCTGTYKYCNSTSGRCVKCRSDADCSASSIYNRCLASTGSCKECVEDEHCAASSRGKRCSSSANRCSCLGEADCPAGTTCSGTYLSTKYCK